MKKLALALAAYAAFVGQAAAADMAVRLRLRLRRPVANWTGCYIAGSVGYGLSTTKRAASGIPSPVGLFIGAPWTWAGEAGWPAAAAAATISSGSAGGAGSSARVSS